MIMLTLILGWVNFYEFFMAALWTSYAHRPQKVECKNNIYLYNFSIVMFRMIDAQEKNEMRFEQMHEVIKWTIKGLGKFFANTVPKGRELQIVSYKAFVSADATNDNVIDYTELVNWIELN